MRPIVEVGAPAPSARARQRTGRTAPQGDALVKQGADATDPATRTSVYRQMTQNVYKDVPSLGLAQSVGFVVMRSWVHGWYCNDVLGGLDYYPIYKE